MDTTITRIRVELEPDDLVQDGDTRLWDTEAPNIIRKSGFGAARIGHPLHAWTAEEVGCTPRVVRQVEVRELDSGDRVQLGDVVVYAGGGGAARRVPTYIGAPTVWGWRLTDSSVVAVFRPVAPTDVATDTIDWEDEYNKLAAEHDELVQRHRKLLTGVQMGLSGSTDLDVDVLGALPDDD